MVQTKTAEVKILKDKKQYRITIPSQIVKELNIDSTKHKFQWVVIKDGNEIELQGRLIKNEKKTR